jgi:hypothetical protein
MEAKHWFALAAVFGLGAEVAACSSKFSSCTESRTCAPSGGSANGDAGEASDLGSAGGGGKTQTTGGSPATDAGASATDAGAPSVEAGAGGEAPAVACDRDSDCNDDLACNGVERCVEGVCRAGISPCANQEPAHCDAVCTEKGGAAACAVRGQDKDKDGHFTTACVAAPGDDCDDSAPTVYSGAPELCDGIDNDCDKKSDLSDGLSLSGKAAPLGPASAVRSRPAIAWADGKSVYGIVYQDTTTSSDSDLYFEELDLAGVLKLTPKAINDSNTASSAGVGLAWGSDTFGVAFAANDELYMRMIGIDGTLTSARILPVPDSQYRVTGVPDVNPALARNANGDWVIASVSHLVAAGNPSLSLNKLSQAGAISGLSVYNAADIGIPQMSVAALGPNFVIGGSSAQLVDPAFKPLTELPATGLYPSVASSANGIAIADRQDTTTAPSVQLFSPAGVSQCGPVPFADKSFEPTSVVATSKGYLIVSSGPLRVQEVFFDCSLGSSFTIDDVTDASDVHIAGSAAGYGVVWQDNVAHLPKARFFGPHYCD